MFEAISHRLRAELVVFGFSSTSRDLQHIVQSPVLQRTATRHQGRNSRSVLGAAGWSAAEREGLFIERSSVQFMCERRSCISISAV